ncbi:uncharacterized protein (TIGR02453 family) [Mucilaginibacter oryzae]|uniref:Uncharacterized protein (TIGR02453 family) n=1 Tax=Mucilaginibacter oryzae TaxID=468058 RepID=A0A316HAY6_9SPHI|nr:DUF2461 domain-containing protein [Mucilaginibacter oryzae]PWK77656.1 uncharacterized protein (TIGR02453 family) [Mucilaginibacter oryzae]
MQRNIPAVRDIFAGIRQLFTMTNIQARIYPSNLHFLQQLKEHNERNWFNANKNTYLKELADIELFAGELLKLMNTHDVIETPSGKKSLHRIYRDTRFSLDKTPFKTNWSGGFKRAGKTRRGGYYFHIEPGNSFVGGGFWGPNADDLKRIREEIAYDAGRLREILNSQLFITNFGALEGEQLKTTPKGFNADNDALNLLRYKQFLLRKPFSDEEVVSGDFLFKMNEAFKAMRPFFDYMSEVLSTDINGIEII